MSCLIKSLMPCPPPGSDSDCEYKLPEPCGQMPRDSSRNDVDWTESGRCFQCLKRSMLALALDLSLAQCVLQSWMLPHCLSHSLCREVFQDLSLIPGRSQCVNSGDYSHKTCLLPKKPEATLSPSDREELACSIAAKLRFSRFQFILLELD